MTDDADKTRQEIIAMIRGRLLIVEEAKRHTRQPLVQGVTDTREFWEGYAAALRSLLKDLEE